MLSVNEIGSSYVNDIKFGTHFVADDRYFFFDATVRSQNVDNFVKIPIQKVFVANIVTLVTHGIFGHFCDRYFW